MNPLVNAPPIFKEDLKEFVITLDFWNPLSNKASLKYENLLPKIFDDHNDYNFLLAVEKAKDKKNSTINVSLNEEKRMIVFNYSKLLETEESAQKK